MKGYVGGRNYDSNTMYKDNAGKFTQNWEIFTIIASKKFPNFLLM